MVQVSGKPENEPLLKLVNEYGTSKEHTIEVNRENKRSQVAHALLRRRSTLEFNGLPYASSTRVQLAINASLVINVILACAKLYASIVSSSLAVLSSLVDSILDLTSQALFWYTDKHMHTPNVKYPAGRRRLEPIAVIISATLMGMGALEVVQKSVETLIEGTGGHLHMSTFTIIVLLFAVCIKIILWYLCVNISSTSPSADALAQDHRNDVFSNVVALSTSALAHYNRKLWYFDPIGAILISAYIAFSWLATGKEQVERLVGLQASEEFIEEINQMANLHHPMMKSDIVRAYHFGNHYLVEVEVILPAKMCVRDAHDISLALQKRIESLHNVERAFVHVDYLSRDYDEHKDPTIRRDSSS